MAAITAFHGEYAFLSNFYRSVVHLDGEAYPTVEHAFQAAKTFDAAERRIVRTSGPPVAARQVGRQVTLRPDWDQVKTGIMRTLLEEKFSDPDLLHKLLATGTVDLVEGNTWNDRIWGAVEVRGQWIGQNRMGWLLMEIRSAARQGN